MRTVGRGGRREGRRSRRRSAARPAVVSNSPVRLLSFVLILLIAGGAEEAVAGARERSGADAFTDATAGRAPVLTIVVAESVAAVDTVEVKVPAENGPFVQHAASDRHQHREGRAMIQGVPLSDEVAPFTGVGVEAGVCGRGESGQQGRGVYSKAKLASAGRHGRQRDEEVAPLDGPDEDVAGEQADGSAGRNGPAVPDDDARRARARGSDPEQSLHRTVKEGRKSPPDRDVDRARGA